MCRFTLSPLCSPRSGLARRLRIGLTMPATHTAILQGHIHFGIQDQWYRLLALYGPNPTRRLQAHLCRASSLIPSRSLMSAIGRLVGGPPFVHDFLHSPSLSDTLDFSYATNGLLCHVYLICVTVLRTPAQVQGERGTVSPGQRSAERRRASLGVGSCEMLS